MKGLRRLESAADAVPNINTNTSNSSTAGHPAALASVLPASPAGPPSAVPVSGPVPASGGPITPSSSSAAASTLSARRATCSQCRVRKVRCDGRQGKCRNCERLRFECSFQQIASPATHGRYVLKLPEPRRRMQACIPCHIKKTRCLGELPSCSNCIRKGRECSYPGTKKQNLTPDGAVGSSSSVGYDAAGPAASTPDPPGKIVGRDTGSVEPAEGATLEFDTMMELVEDYFLHLYPLPSFAFLHRPTVIQRCREHTINEPLKLAICALTSLQLQRASLPHDLWIQQAEQSILQHLGRPSIFHLQALLLVIRYRIENGDFPTAFMLAALASRTAVALRLNYERAELSSVAQEARRRLFWSLYLLDDFFCVGLREFEMFPEETIHLLLPCDEELFQAGQCSQTGFLHTELPDANNVGLRGIFYRVTSARRAIMSFIRRVGLGEETPETMSESIARFEQRLKYLHDSLATSDQYSAENLAASKLQAQYIMAHMSYHQCHCDLYRIFLSGYSEAAPPPVLAGIHPHNRLAMQRKCLEHAEGIIGILSDFSRVGSNDSLLERDAAVCAFEAARIAMFGSFMSPPASTHDIALGKARLCLHIITKFFPYSASTRTLRQDLERLVNNYSVRHAQQTRGPALRLDSSSTRTSTRVSQYATSRQRLSVQSLLLQSDFVDDSDEIASPNPRESDSHHHQQFHGQIPADMPAAQQLSSAGHPSPPRSNAQPPQPQQLGSMSGAPPVGGAGLITDGLANVPAPLAATGVHALPGSGLVDMGQDDTGLAFNPWMGFTGNEEFLYSTYGLSSTGLNEEY